MAQLIAAITSPDQAVVIADVKRAFESVNPDAIYELPFMPEALVRRVIDYRNQTFVCMDRSAQGQRVAHGDPMVCATFEVPPSGLMEGSPASNAIFAVLMDDLPDHLHEGILPFMYCDNVILVAPSMSFAQQAHEALVRYFTDHRAGPFELRSEVKSVNEPFEHLGYQFQWIEGEGLRVQLSLGNWIELMKRLNDQEKDVRMTADWLATSFPHCTQNARDEYDYLISFEATDRAGGSP